MYIYILFKYIQFGFPSLNDGSNFQFALIPVWKSNNSVCELIEKIPDLIDNIEEESKNNLFSFYGTYSKTLVYNINDFLTNNQNKLYKIHKIKGMKNKKINLENRFLIITDIYVIILINEDSKKKNKCRIEYLGEIFNIQSINESDIENEEDLEALTFDWVNESENNFNFPIIIKIEDKNDLIELIITKKTQLISKFSLYLNNEENDIKVLSQILEIKEKILEKHPDDFTLRIVTELYQKIIEIYSKNNNEGFQFYIQKLHDTIEKYDKIKLQKKKIKEENKNKKEEKKEIKEIKEEVKKEEEKKEEIKEEQKKEEEKEEEKKEEIKEKEEKEEIKEVEKKEEQKKEEIK